MYFCCSVFRLTFLDHDHSCRATDHGFLRAGIERMTRPGLGFRCFQAIANLLPFVLMCSVLWLIGIDRVAAADSVVIEQPTVGWGGHYVVGRWTPVLVPVKSSRETDVQLELTAVDSDGNRVGYLSPKTHLKTGENQLAGLIKVGRLNGEIGVRIDESLEMTWAPGRTKGLATALTPSNRIIVTVGQPKGFESEAELSSPGRPTKIAPVAFEDLPRTAAAYDAVHTVVLAGQINLSADQANALKGWVAEGGRLVISLRHNSSEARQSVQSMSEWLPVSIAEQPVIVREFGGLEGFSGKNNRMPQTTTLSIPSLQMKTGETLAASRSDGFLVRTPYGMGSVTVLAMDLTTNPLAEWKALRAFCARMIGIGASVEANERAVGKGAQLSSTGVSDLATQLHGSQDHFESVNRVSPWFVMGMILLLLALVGPLDYLLVHRLLKRPHLTWVTFPLLIALSATVASYSAMGSNGSARYSNQLDIVNIDVATEMALGHHYVSLYSPTTSQTSISVRPLPLVEGTPELPAARVVWQGVPEAAFGGMLRDTGFEQGARYQQQPDGELTGLPILQWSSKSLVADSVQSVKGLIDSDFKASATGRLTGTMTHHFAGPLHDWMIVYKNVVYRQLKKKDDPTPIPLVQKQLWRVDQPSVYAREVRAFLTGTTTFAVPRSEAAMGADFKNHSAMYDPLSRDPQRFLQILTFHEEAGGERYTGLTNQMLDDEDCSRLLKLGRAVFLGRLEQPVATISQDGAAVKTDRRTTFVRLILPVAPPNETIQNLKRLVPE